MKARMKDIDTELEKGGRVIFQHLTGWCFLIHADNRQRKTIDGRTYHGFLKTRAPKLVRTEAGSIETHDLVIEWRNQ